MKETLNERTQSPKGFSALVLVTWETNVGSTVVPLRLIIQMFVFMRNNNHSHLGDVKEKKISYNLKSLH